VLADALSLVLVTTPSMNSSAARARLYKRGAPAEEWIPEGKAEAAVVGKAGLAWGHGFLEHKVEGDAEKTEGDLRTPAGIFPIGRTFGFDASNHPGHVVLKVGETLCVDDPASPAYNKIVSRQDVGPSVSAEDMRAIPLYRAGIVVDYPTDREGRRGSCIFIHVWRGPGMGTAGCVAMPEPRVKALQVFTRKPSVLAILPESALKQFRECLPTSSAKRSEVSDRAYSPGFR
jgi:D-alanyl-D-alanine dipeptidase